MDKISRSKALKLSEQILIYAEKNRIEVEFSNEECLMLQKREEEVEKVQKRVVTYNALQPQQWCPLLDGPYQTDCVNWRPAMYNIVPESLVGLFGTHVEFVRPGCEFFKRYLSLPEKDLMSYTIAGACPTCGAPIYVPTVWSGVTPPPQKYTCNCNNTSTTTTTMTTVTVNSSKSP